MKALLFFEEYLTFFLELNMLIYFVAGISFCAKKQRLAKVIFIFAFILNIALIGINWMGCGHPPLGNMYHVLIVLAACFFPVWFLLSWREKLGWILPYLAFAAGVPLIGTIFMNPSLEWQRIPALQSAWFVPHVLAYMISYSLAAVAFVLGIVSLCKKEINETCLYKNEFEAAVHSIIRLAIPFMTFGLLSGALWADTAWGIYWSWDPKESWALITWLLYLGYLHSVGSEKWKRKAIYLSLFAFFALIVTFLVVNLLPKFASGLHSYT